MSTHSTARSLLALLVGVSFAWAAPVLAKPNMRAVEKSCKPGSDPQEAGNDSHPGGFLSSGKLTPQKIPGATTVSAREAKCLLEKMRNDLVVVAAMYTDEKLPETHILRSGASSSSDPEVQERFAEEIKHLVNGDKDRPLLIYCHHIYCHLSYNTTLRAVNAGYTKVYWLREGNSGWKKAGYPLAGEEPDENGLPPVYHQEIQACDKLYFKHTANTFAIQAVQNPDDAELNAAFQRDMKEAQERRGQCLSKLSSRFSNNQAALADIAKRVARSDAEVRQQFQASRTAVESNPTRYFKDYLDSYDISAMHHAVHIARTLKSLHDLCGTVNTSIPTTQAALDAARERRSTYFACLDRVSEDESDDIDEISFNIAAMSVAGTARYTCSRRKTSNCLPDATWRRVADVASAYNNALMQAAKKRRQSRQGPELDAAYERVNDLVVRTNAYIARRNQEVEEYNRHQSYSSPSYTPPSYGSGRYGTGRRDSSTSAPGMR
jgi:rhodanese-related sulfurtransferase/uncharacterized protein YecT (DUF1311 family)